MSKSTNSFRYLSPELLIFLGMPVVMLISMVTMRILSLREWPWVYAMGSALALSVMGAGCLLVAKWPLYRAGRFFSFGTRGLPVSSVRFYRVGWGLSGAGMVLAVLLLMGAKFWSF